MTNICKEISRDADGCTLAWDFALCNPEASLSPDGCMHYHIILGGVYYLFWDDVIARNVRNLWRFTIFKKRYKIILFTFLSLFSNMICGQFQFSLFILDAGKQAMISIKLTNII